MDIKSCQVTFLKHKMKGVFLCSSHRNLVSEHEERGVQGVKQEGREKGRRKRRRPKKNITSISASLGMFR